MMIRIQLAAIAAVTIFVSMSVMAADESAKKTPQERYEAVLKKRKGYEVGSLEFDRDAAQNAVKRAIRERKPKAVVDGLKASVADLQKKIDVLSDPKTGYPTYFYGSLTVGDIGTPYSIEVRQIVNENEMLAEFEIRAKNETGRRIVELVWLSGVSTEGLVDGRKFTLQKCFDVVGTKKYDTALGATKTVMAVELADVKMNPY